MPNSDFIRKYWTQIDLHSHTLHGVDCKGSSDSANYSHANYLNAIKSFGTQLQAVTNHNTFYIEDHVKHAILCDLAGIGYIPGVEIDIQLKDKSRPFHCVFLLGPKNDICKFSNYLNSETNNKRTTGKVYYNEDEISSIFAGMHFIYVVHGVKKKGLAENQESLPLDRENIDWVCQAIKNASAEPVLFENTSPHNVYAFANRFREFTDRLDLIEITEQQVTSSDYKFDNDVGRLNAWKAREKFAICAEATYEGLELSIRHYKNRFQLVSEIVEPVSFIESFSFSKRSDNRFNVDGAINCSPYFNVIIGNSGSGKTLLLNELYRSVAYKNLNAVLTTENKKKTNNGSVSVYEGFIGKNKTLLAPKVYGGKPVAIEVDKIYKLLLDAEEPTEIASMFGVSIPPDVNTVLLKYQEKVNDYENTIKGIDIEKAEGEKALDTIYSNFLFIENNAVEKTSFLLKRVVFDDTVLKKFNSRLNSINQLRQDKEKVDDWINRVKNILPDNQTTLIDDFVLKYKEILNALDDQSRAVKKEIAWLNIDYRIINHYNNSLEEISGKVSNKQTEVDKASSTIAEQSNAFRECIKNNILLELKTKTVNLSYPFNEIREKTESSQTNSHARVYVEYLDSDKTISKNNYMDNRLIETGGNLTKIKNAVNKQTYNLDNSDDVKSFINELHTQGLSFLDLLSKEIPFITQIKDEGVWKNAIDINPGNLAKNYMSFYFQQIIDVNRPNVVFIDQPENDVDKSFISEVLASFISKHKKSVQFFITSHEPILGVNADSNLIIEAYRNSGGAISYRAKKFEYVSSGNVDESGVQVASRILDGGKNNVIKRNQIYGGSIDD